MQKQLEDQQYELAKLRNEDEVRGEQLAAMQERMVYVARLEHVEQVFEQQEWREKLELVDVVAEKCLSLFEDLEWLKKEVAMIGGRLDALIDVNEEEEEEEEDI